AIVALIRKLISFPPSERITSVDAEAVEVAADRHAQAGRERAREIVADRRLQRGVAVVEVEVLDAAFDLELVVHTAANPKLQAETVVVDGVRAVVGGGIDVEHPAVEIDVRLHRVAVAEADRPSVEVDAEVEVFLPVRAVQVPVVSELERAGEREA